MCKPPINEAINSAVVALAAYSAMQNDTATNLRDVLADLMHLCDAKDIDFANELSLAQANYRREVRADNRHPNY
jgi:hypothetical protein